MSTTAWRVFVIAEAKSILEQALSLPEKDRAELIEVPQESLADAPYELSPEWQAEIARRIETVERGKSQLIPGDEVEARVRALLARI